MCVVRWTNIDHDSHIHWLYVKAKAFGFGKRYDEKIIQKEKRKKNECDEITEYKTILTECEENCRHGENEPNERGNNPWENERIMWFNQLLFSLPIKPAIPFVILR